MNRINLILLFSIYILYGCENNSPYLFKSKKEMTKEINIPSNGFIGSFIQGKLIYETLFVPAYDNDSIITIKLRISHSDGKRVLEHNATGEQEIQLRENALSFELSEDVFMEIEGKEIPPLISHYERNYGLKPSIDLFFQFKKNDTEKDVFFNYRDKIFESGLIRIKIKQKNYNSSYHE